MRTTLGEPSAQQVPDLLRRDFIATAPNQRYVGDITYLPLENGGFLYLASVIDLFSRRLAGWSIADHMRTELVVDALRAAAATRGSLAGAIMHTDHGAIHIEAVRGGVRRTRSAPVPGSGRARAPTTPSPRRGTAA